LHHLLQRLDDPDHVQGVKVAVVKQFLAQAGVDTLAREYGATRLVLFGSAADDPETARDLDLAWLEALRAGGTPGKRAENPPRPDPLAARHPLYPAHRAQRTELAVTSRELQ
jgi:hypothetical protein